MTLYSNKVKHYPNKVRYYFDKVRYYPNDKTIKNKVT